MDAGALRAAAARQRKRPLGEVVEPADAIVRVLGLDALGGEDLGGEILEVERDDHLGPAMDRRRQHVPVVGIR